MYLQRKRIQEPDGGREHESFSIQPNAMKIIANDMPMKVVYDE